MLDKIRNGNFSSNFLIVKYSFAVNNSNRIYPECLQSIKIKMEIPGFYLARCYLLGIWKFKRENLKMCFPHGLFFVKNDWIEKKKEKRKKFMVLNRK